MDKEDLINIILDLEEKVRKLEEQQNRNSQNSSKPPSADGYKKPVKPKSDRTKSGKKPGGQLGHKGTTLEPVENPDVVKDYERELHRCSECNHDLSNVKSSYTSRQEVDIPQVKPIITEHRIASKVCPNCKAINSAGPKDLTQAIQYGARVRALASYLHYSQLIPIKRIQELLSDVLGLRISEGTVVSMHKGLYEQLTDTEAQIKTSLLQKPVNHSDETSMTINGKTCWLHVVSNAYETAYFTHKKRGKEAMDAMDILPRYTGVVVHDHWKPYFRYEHIKHSLCNAHHLRELRGMYENYDQSWALDLRTHLLHINKTVDDHKKFGRMRLSDDELRNFSNTYDAILERGQKQIPETNFQPKHTKRGRKKQHPSKNFLDRLTNRKEETLRFMYDFRVPFTNNQGEQDIRMTKVKQKISGCYRSEDGAERFCRIRGYISTANKNGFNIFSALENAIRGQPFQLQA